jgi:hypothetical protein
MESTIKSDGKKKGTRKMSCTLRQAPVSSYGTREDETKIKFIEGLR